MTSAEYSPLSQISKKVSAAFVHPCLKHFGFLEKDLGFRGSFFSVAGETTVSFEKGNRRLLVFFNIPEVPSVEIYTTDDGRVEKKEKVVSSSEEVKKKIKEMNAIRDKRGLEIWHETLKKGGFDVALDIILGGLAEKVGKSF
jgi:hypothetical protein